MLTSHLRNNKFESSLIIVMCLITNQLPSGGIYVKGSAPHLQWFLDTIKFTWHKEIVISSYKIKILSKSSALFIVIPWTEMSHFIDLYMTCYCRLYFYVFLVIINIWQHGRSFACSFRDFIINTETVFLKFLKYLE